MADTYAFGEAGSVRYPFVAWAAYHQPTRRPVHTFPCQDTPNLPTADNSIGAVNCWNAIWALPQRREAIREMSRVLKPGRTFTCLLHRVKTDRLGTPCLTDFRRLT